MGMGARSGTCQGSVLLALRSYLPARTRFGPASYSISPKPRVLALLAVGEVVPVPAVSIRNLDDRVKARLRLRAARHGRSMEAEMRVILTESVREPGDDEGLVLALLRRFAELGGVELDIPARGTRPRAADLG